MTQEDKELLLKDLSARVPYHPKGLVVNACTGVECEEWLTCATFTMFTSITNNCRLYLRPMSNMTEEESEEFANMEIVGYNNYDWLNKHHFDYRGLIKKGLAIEAPFGMYNK